LTHYIRQPTLNRTAAPSNRTAQKLLATRGMRSSGGLSFEENVTPSPSRRKFCRYGSMAAIFLKMPWLETLNPIRVF
jgi:hypothetical protein